MVLARMRAMDSSASSKPDSEGAPPGCFLFSTLTSPRTVSLGSLSGMARRDRSFLLARYSRTSAV